jgi:predicted NBD/HSP70 family sugar kinase
VRTGNRDLIKQINRNIVLNLIKSRGPLSRTDIARLSGLSLATVSSLTGELLNEGFAQETGEAESTGGRRPVLLRLNPRGGYVVGLKLTEESIVSAVTDLEANVLYSRVTPVAGADEVDAGLAALRAAVEETLRESGVPREKVIGIGIGLAGVIDSQAGVCRYSPFLRWRDVQICDPIEQHFHLPVFIENDVNTLTIAEQWFGVGHGVRHFLVVTLGRGIGLGIVLNGQFYAGARGGAGEFGHITLEIDGPLCDCGKRGCLEALAADPALVRMAYDAVQTGAPDAGGPLRRVLERTGRLTVDDIWQAAGAGDAQARAVLDRAGHYLGLGIAQLVNILNPQLIILAGEGVRGGEARLKPVRDAVQQHTLPSLASDLKLAVEPSGDEAWARGAACLVLGELFKHPIHKGEAAGPAPTG